MSHDLQVSSNMSEHRHQFVASPYSTRLNQQYLCYCQPDLYCDCAQVKQKLKEAKHLYAVYTKLRAQRMEEANKKMKELEAEAELEARTAAAFAQAGLITRRHILL